MELVGLTLPVLDIYSYVRSRGVELLYIFLGQRCSESELLTKEFLIIRTPYICSSFWQGVKNWLDVLKDFRPSKKKDMKLLFFHMQ
jgi:hypothetical protein